MIFERFRKTYSLTANTFMHNKNFSNISLLQFRLKEQEKCKISRLTTVLCKVEIFHLKKSYSQSKIIATLKYWFFKKITLVIFCYILGSTLWCTRAVLCNAGLLSTWRYRFCTICTFLWHRRKYTCLYTKKKVSFYITWSKK